MLQYYKLQLIVNTLKSYWKQFRNKSTTPRLQHNMQGKGGVCLLGKRFLYNIYIYINNYFKKILFFYLQQKQLPTQIMWQNSKNGIHNFIDPSSKSYASIQLLSSTTITCYGTNSLDINNF